MLPPSNRFISSVRADAEISRLLTFHSSMDGLKVSLFEFIFYTGWLQSCMRQLKLGGVHLFNECQVVAVSACQTENT
jgi:hypothetical protein